MDQMAHTFRPSFFNIVYSVSPPHPSYDIRQISGEKIADGFRPPSQALRLNFYPQVFECMDGEPKPDIALYCGCILRATPECCCSLYPAHVATGTLCSYSKVFEVILCVQ